MSPSPFKASREDGKSDRVVIYDAVSHAAPETFYSYDDLIKVLGRGLKVSADKMRVYRAVAAANKTLLREDRRYLSVVRNEGYRIVRADEHLDIALTKKDQAQSYLRKGMDLLKHARLDELTEIQRTLHEGQLMILAGVYRAVVDSERRHDRQEQIIDGLTRRVDKLDGGDIEK